MKPRSIAFAFVLFAGIGLAGSGSTDFIGVGSTEARQRAHENGRFASPVCSIASVAGRYAGNYSGTLYPPLVPVPAPAMATGLFEVSGAGTITGKDRVSIAGQQITRTLTGTYSVAPDCSMSIVLTAQSGQPGLVVQLDAAIVDGGREIVFIERDPATMFTGSMKAM